MSEVYPRNSIKSFLRSNLHVHVVKILQNKNYNMKRKKNICTYSFNYFLYLFENTICY